MTNHSTRCPRPQRFSAGAVSTVFLTGVSLAEPRASDAVSNHAPPSAGLQRRRLDVGTLLGRRNFDLTSLCGPLGQPTPESWDQGVCWTASVKLCPETMRNPGGWRAPRSTVLSRVVQIRMAASPAVRVRYSQFDNSICRAAGRRRGMPGTRRTVHGQRNRRRARGPISESSGPAFPGRTLGPWILAGAGVQRAIQLARTTRVFSPSRSLTLIRAR